jgi:GT2 family glycosyltransferase
MRAGVMVGIHTHAQPARLIETVRSVQANGADCAGIVLLPDGPDAALSVALTSEPVLTSLSQWGTAEPMGAPACFNRLASRSDAQLVVLVESGTVLGPGCLPLLVEALASPGRGLAGPSTNRAWNEQRVFPSARSSDVARTATIARQRFGPAVRSLEPLHSLADFCLSVTREVIEAIGGADAQYGLGPCWEMDYSIRAARAGFQGVWVGAAYAYRHLLTERRRAAEARLMDHARHLYQDRFCGLRLSQQHDDYKDQCRGEACEHFAPASLITIRRPLGPPADTPAGLTDKASATVLAERDGGPSAEPTRRARPALRPARAAANRPARDPLVSCVMPTFERRYFVPQSVRYFLRQDYPSRELIVVDDGPEPVNDLLPADPRIRYHRLEARTILGAKRNLACDLARGSIIVHWDDDDWASAGRVSMQVAALRKGDADICGVARLLYYDPASSSAWRFTWPEGFRPWAAGCSLCFWKDLWAKSPFPEIAIGEDTRFVFSPAVRRIAYVHESACIVGIIHRRNTAPKSVGGTHWSRRPIREVEDILGDDIAFYHHLESALPQSR